MRVSQGAGRFQSRVVQLVEERTLLHTGNCVARIVPPHMLLVRHRFLFVHKARLLMSNTSGSIIDINAKTLYSYIAPFIRFTVVAVVHEC